MTELTENILRLQYESFKKYVDLTEKEIATLRAKLEKEERGVSVLRRFYEIVTTKVTPSCEDFIHSKETYPKNDHCPLAEEYRAIVAEYEGLREMEEKK